MLLVYCPFITGVSNWLNVRVLFFSPAHSTKKFTKKKKENATIFSPDLGYSLVVERLHGSLFMCATKVYEGRRSRNRSYRTRPAWIVIGFQSVCLPSTRPITSQARKAELWNYSREIAAFMCLDSGNASPMPGSCRPEHTLAHIHSVLSCSCRLGTLYIYISPSFPLFAIHPWFLLFHRMEWRCNVIYSQTGWPLNGSLKELKTRRVIR